MHKSGDLLKNIEKLKVELKQIKFPEKLDHDSAIEGYPFVFLPILHYALLNYSPYVAQLLHENDYDLFSKNDKEFIAKLFKAMIDLFNHKPLLNPQQFFKNGYAEAKVLLCIDVIEIVKGEHNKQVKRQYKPQNLKRPCSRGNDSFRSIKDEANTSNISTSKGRETKNDNPKVKIINHRLEGDNRNIKATKPSQSNPVVCYMKDYYTDSNLLDDLREDEILVSPKFNEANISLPKYFEPEDKRDENKKNLKEEMEINVVDSSEDFPHGGKSVYSEEKQTVHDTPIDKGRSHSKIPAMEFSSLVNIINALADSVKQMTTKVDEFKTSVETRVSKLEGEVSLIKNKLILMENKTKANLTESLNSNDEHIFSFAMEDKKTETMRQHDINDHSQHSKYNTYKERKFKNVNEATNKILNNVIDTDSIIERVEKRFRETQKLLNELK